MSLWYSNQVVDARAGPGMRSISKFKSKNKKLVNSNRKLKKKKEFEREYSPALSDKSDPIEDVDMVIDDYLEGGPSGSSSRTVSPRNSDSEENVAITSSRKRKGQAKKRDGSFLEFSDFISTEYWKK